MASPASESKLNVAKTTPVSCPVFGNKRPTTDFLESLEFEEELEELELDEEVELEELEDELLEDELDELLELEEELELEDELLEDELELEEGPVVLGEVVVPVPESL